MTGLQIQMRPVLELADRIWTELGQELVVTSATEGQHRPGSLHYYGYALDLRTRYFTEEEKRAAAQLLRGALTDIDARFMVLKESTHIHVEWIGALKHAYTNFPAIYCPVAGGAANEKTRAA